MNQFFQLLFRLLLFFMGAAFFLILLFVACVMMLIFWVRSLWYRLTGKTPQGVSGVKINPLSGFEFFYSRSSDKNREPPRPSKREMDDVSDVVIKEIKKPDEME